MPALHSQSAATRTPLTAAAMQTVESELAQDHFSTAIGKFREAMNLSRGYPDLEDQVLTLAADLGRQLLPRNWQVAKSFLNEAAEFKPGYTFASNLLEEIQRHERDQSFQRVPRLSVPFPAEPLASVRTVAVAITPIQSVSKPAKSTRLQPSTLNHLKSAATLIFATAAIAAAVALIWFHQPRRIRRPLNTDSQAWSTVNPNDADQVESYLSRFPNGTKRDQAVQALVQIRVTHRESAEVLDAIHQYASQKGIQVSTTSQPRIDGNQATVQCFSNQTPVTFELARQHGSWNIESTTR